MHPCAINGCIVRHCSSMQEPEHACRTFPLVNRVTALCLVDDPSRARALTHITHMSWARSARRVFSVVCWPLLTAVPFIHQATGSTTASPAMQSARSGPGFALALLESPQHSIMKDMSVILPNDKRTSIMVSQTCHISLRSSSCSVFERIMC